MLARHVFMFVFTLSVILTEKSWLSLSFKSNPNVDLASKGRAHKNETAIAGLDMLGDRVSQRARGES
jgi:hypothetical protein